MGNDVQFSSVFASGVCLLVLLGTGGAANAEEEQPASPYTDAKAALLAASKGDSAAYLAYAIRSLGRSAAASKDKIAKKEPRKLLRPHLRSRKPEIVRAAIEAYAVMALPGSSRDLRQLVERKLSEDRPHELRLAALDAWGRIADKGTHVALLDCIRVPSRHAEKRERAVAAAKSLAHYKKIPKKKRYELLKDLMKTYDMIYGAGSGGIFPSAAAAEWWEAVGGEMLTSFNALAGTKLKSYHDCGRWWRKNKGKVKAGKL